MRAVSRTDEETWAALVEGVDTNTVKEERLPRVRASLWRDNSRSLSLSLSLSLPLVLTEWTEKPTFRGVVEPLAVPERWPRVFPGERDPMPPSLRDLLLRPVNGERGVSGA